MHLHFTRIKTRELLPAEAQSGINNSTKHKSKTRAQATRTQQEHVIHTSTPRHLTCPGRTAPGCACPGSCSHKPATVSDNTSDEQDTYVHAAPPHLLGLYSARLCLPRPHAHISQHTYQTAQMTSKIHRCTPGPLTCRGRTAPGCACPCRMLTSASTPIKLHKRQA